MNESQFSLEFELNATEIRKLNKMYFKNIWEERIRFFLGLFFVIVIFFNCIDLDNDSDYLTWLIRNLILVLFFLLFQYSMVKTICNLIFELVAKLLKSDKFVSQYKFNFTNSLINVHLPIGGITHKWSQIEKAILTRDFFYLYIKERNGYIISISNKCNQNRNIDTLIAFVENKVTHITKVC